MSWRENTDHKKSWQSALVSHPPFVVNQTQTFMPFEIKVKAVNELGEGASPEAVIGHPGEDSTLHSFSLFTL